MTNIQKQDAYDDTMIWLKYIYWSSNRILEKQFNTLFYWEIHYIVQGFVLTNAQK